MPNAASSADACGRGIFDDTGAVHRPFQFFKVGIGWAPLCPF